MKNTIISPSLLSCDFTQIKAELDVFRDIPDLWFHLDIMDGHFVPNLTFGGPVARAISEESPQPCDAHLMVSNPKFHIELMKDHRLVNLTFHWEAANTPLALIEQIKKNHPSAGLSLKPKTLIGEISDDVLREVDLVLLMSVEPGFGGQRFMESVLPKVKSLRLRAQEIQTELMIQVDGGVSDENASKLRDAGADNLVAGSYIFKAGQKYYKERVESLRS